MFSSGDAAYERYPTALEVPWNFYEGCEEFVPANAKPARVVLNTLVFLYEVWVHACWFRNVPMLRVGLTSSYVFLENWLWWWSDFQGVCTSKDCRGDLTNSGRYENPRMHTSRVESSRLSHRPDSRKSDGFDPDRLLKNARTKHHTRA